MLRSLTAAIAIVSCAGSTVRADPITYQFRGTFDQPMNGTDRFSGTFTFNPNPTVDNVGSVVGSQTVISKGTGPYGVAQTTAYTFSPNDGFLTAKLGPIAEYGNDVSLTVNMGGRVIHYLNTPQNPFAATLDAGLLPPPLHSRDIPTGNYARINGVTAEYAPGNSFSNNSFGIGFASYTTNPIFQDLAPDQVADLGRFDFKSTILGVSAGGPTGLSYNGTITSIERVTTPEPSTLFVLAASGMALMAFHACRRGG